MTNFDQVLSVPAEEIQILLHGHVQLPWNEFRLNQHRICGSDFLTRWSQTAWAESLLIYTVEETEGYFAVPYGPRAVAPAEDVREFALYCQDLERAGFADQRRPDLLVFLSRDKNSVEKVIRRLGHQQLLPFTPESSPDMRRLLSLAVLALKCESSLWITEDFPSPGARPKPTMRPGRRPRRARRAASPTMALKEDDCSCLHQWQEKHHVPVHFWHVFFDAAFGISLSEAETLIEDKLVAPSTQVYQAPNGEMTKKVVYRFPCRYAYKLNRAMDMPELRANFIEDKNGHILPYVKFHGGSLSLAQEAVSILSEAATAKTAWKRLAAAERLDQA